MTTYLKHSYLCIRNKSLLDKKPIFFLQSITNFNLCDNEAGKQYQSV